MSWRTVVISNRAKLDYQLGFLVVRRNEIVKIHMSEISILLIETTAVSLTVALLSELTKRKIKVIFCDEKRNPTSELIPYYGAHDTSAKVRKQIEWSSELKLAIWTEIVTEKIRKQAETLERLNKEEAQMLYGYIEEIEFGDKTNREGHAAKVYFNALFGMDFTRTTENSINAALNYGYGIILSACNREITANGYITQLGLFHDNMFNPFSLDCNNKKVITRLHQELKDQMNENLIEETAKINQSILEYLEKVIYQVPYALDYNVDFDAMNLLKMYEVKVDNLAEDLLEKIVEYVKAMNRICNMRIFVFVGLKQYLTENELEQLYEFIFYEHIYLIILEPKFTKVLNGEKSCILDSDLCIIEP